MSFSSGTFSLYVVGNPVVTGTTITSSWANNTLDDIATGLSTCVLKDGTQTTTSAVPFAAGITGTTVTMTGNIVTSAGTVEAAGAVSAGDNSAHGYSAANGFELIGQGSTNDVSIMNDIGTIIARIPTGADTWTLPKGQITFPATQNSSTNANTLDDYEEGTGTLSMTFTTAGNQSIILSVDDYNYVKVGRLVVLSFTLVTSTFTHSTASGDLRILTLPFTSTNTANLFYYGNLQWSGITSAYTDVCIRTTNNSAFVNLEGSKTAAASAAIDYGDMPTGGTVDLRGTISYLAAA
jgi:hypothetical protein